MSKDNLFLGMARGSVGDVTFSRLNGVQVARARNRAPRNPQSPAQMVQRIIMSTVGKAYSMMQEICNHSFEGFEVGQMSQRKFMEVNVGLMRDKVADVLAFPVAEVIRTSSAFNFSFKNDYAPVLNEYQISAGSLPSVPLISADNGIINTIPLTPGDVTMQTATYADIVSLLGLQRGDQLTFIMCSHDRSAVGHDTDITTGFRFARIILEPASGDMTTTFFRTTGAMGVNDPNERNAGEFSEFLLDTTEGRTGLRFLLKDIAAQDSTSYPDRALCASAVILSRQVGGRWLRSTQFLRARNATGTSALNHSTLGLAYETYQIGAASDLYLNQAE